MTSRRSMLVLRGLTSLAITLLFLVGVPIALTVLVGWPLPASVPNVDALGQAMQTGISDGFIVNTLAVIAWLAWTQLALAIVSESIGLLRGRNPLRLPVAPGLQVIAARLVTGIVLLTGPLQPARAGAEPARVAIVAEAHPVAAEVIDLRPLYKVPANQPTAEAPSGGSAVTVQRHDSYWAIAERTMGDGLRWHEIHDLNVGRTMSDGYTITTGDDTLRAGWQLALPAGATPTEPTTESEVVVEQGDSVWGLAEERLATDLERAPADAEVTPYWSDVIEANSDRFVDPGNPSLILPGQVLAMPATGHAATFPTPPPIGASPAPVEPAPATPELTPTTTAPATTSTTIPSSSSTIAAATTSPAEAAASGSDDRPESRATPVAPDDDSSDSALPVGLAVGGLSSVALAVGIKRLINKRRREYANSHDGQAPAPSDPDQRALHQTVVVMADEARLDDLQLVLGWLSVQLAEAGTPRRPRVVRHSSTSVEVLLDKPSLDAPTGWTAVGDGLVWTLDAGVDLDEPLDGPMCPAPLLVTIGQPDDDAQLYLDLEVDGVVSLAGDIEVARDLARSMLTELALSPLADTLRVIVIGDLVEPEVSHLDHITLVDTWSDIAQDLTSWVGESNQALIENNWPNTFVARGHEPDHDALVPIAVIATKPPPPELLALLLQGRPSAVAIVVADEFEGSATSIYCDPGALTLDDVDLSFAPQAVDADELEAMGRLLIFDDPPLTEGDDGDDDPSEVESEAGYRHGEDPSEIDANGAAPPEAAAIEPPDYDVLVRLLGDIRVDGGSKHLNPKPTSVVAYLALHRAVTSDRLEEACWFGANGTSHRKRLRDVMTECRDALGSHHFPANRDGTYKAGPRIRTDLELFDWHVSRAADQEGPEAMDSYRTALDLVNGKPFSYANAARMSFGWVDFEHHATTWEHRISGVAKAYTELCIDLDRHDDAIDLLRHLLQAVPLNGGIVEALMRVHLANGDRSSAEALYQEHAKALDKADLGDPDEAVEQLRLEFTCPS